MAICNRVLQAKGSAYPRTCDVCGLGPCPASNQMFATASVEWENAGEGFEATLLALLHLRSNAAGDNLIVAYVKDVASRHYRDGFEAGRKAKR